MSFKAQREVAKACADSATGDCIPSRTGPLLLSKSAYQVETLQKKISSKRNMV